MKSGKRHQHLSHIARNFELQQSTWGVGADLENDIQLLGYQQRIGYGFELVQNERIGPSGWRADEP